jgi:methylated-DNA-[protein]-cysteine S-methyltransferase
MIRQKDFLGYYRSPIGWLKVHGRDKAIAGVECVAKGAKAKLPAGVRKTLDRYFDGKPGFSGARFALTGTFFQKRVWSELRRIPWGKNISYAQLGRLVGRPKAVRAVAGAVGRNPVAVLIPCHRVIGSDGSLTGYAYGLKKKAWLIAHEKRYNPRSDGKRS